MFNQGARSRPPIPPKRARMIGELKRMGRPKLAPDEKREAQLPPVRVTVAELHHVEDQAAAAGCSVTEFTRRAVLGIRVQPRQSVADDRLLIELNRVGNLMNQIARSLHTDRPERADLAETIGEFRQLVALLVARA